MALRPESWGAIAVEAGDPAEALLGMTTLIGIAICRPRRQTP